MNICKKYHFYAAHRNQELRDKCRNIHGHTYFVEVTLSVVCEDNIAMLFSDIDQKIEPIIETYDHALLIDRHDPLYSHLLAFDEPLKLKPLDRPSSVENLCRSLFSEIAALNLPITRITIQETTSSIVEYEGDERKSI